MKILTRVLLIVTLWLPGIGAAETVSQRGAALAQTCVTCHESQGKSLSATLRPQTS